MTAIERIRNLIEFLPEKDRSLANQFLNKRDFNSLLEIVKADMYKERKKLKLEEIDEQESKVLANMDVLKAELIYYLDGTKLYEPEDFLEYEEY